MNMSRNIELIDAGVSTIILYPNPVTDNLKIGLTPLNKGTTFRLYYATGAVVISSSLTNSTSTISLNSLPAGIYYVQVKNGQQITTKKIVKQ
jgi:hypothetical protein